MSSEVIFVILSEHINPTRQAKDFCCCWRLWSCRSFAQEQPAEAQSSWFALLDVSGVSHSSIL